jgi:acetyl-CoA carboxylase biotin carboxyl carrier protein
MNKRKLEELIELMEDRGLQELHVSRFLGSVHIVRSSATASPAGVVPVGTPEPSPQATPPPTAPVEQTTVTEPEEPDRDSGLVPIVSPMVGTFYAAPSPESPPYVRQGDRVNKGQVVCIVEAMKLMNEIESEVGGTIVRVVVENAQPVEYGQTLFLVEPD